MAETELEFMRAALRRFREERGWQDVHTPHQLVEGLAIEAGELLECFQWGERHDEKAANEMADVLIYLINLADVMNIDLAQAFWLKVERNNKRFPVGKRFQRSIERRS
jgi:dCTP diphosphatase